MSAEEKSFQGQVRYWAHPARASTQRGLQIANVAAQMQCMDTQEKKTYVQKWFQSCGPKGDLSAFIESSMTTK
eukprot:2270813-Amphidinium_carterae.1